MRASRLPFPPKESYWASNVVFGVGLGTKSLVSEILLGVGGVVIEPYKGAKRGGFGSGVLGFFKGLGGLVGRPIKGLFDFVAQPVAGIVNTPGYCVKKLTTRPDPTSLKQTNFKIFGVEDAELRKSTVKNKKGNQFIE